MDEYQCDVYADHSSEFDPSNISSSCLTDRIFNAEFNCTNLHVLSARRFRTSSETKCLTFQHATKDDMIRKETILSWLFQTDIPQDAYEYVEARILERLNDMVKTTHKNSRVFSIRVNICITRAREDESSESDADGYEIDQNSERDEDSNDEDNSSEEDIEFVPAAKSCVEKLEKVEKEGKCAICFEDFSVGLVMPCSHMYHPKCISDWLEIGNSCPLCRFELPTQTNL